MAKIMFSTPRPISEGLGASQPMISNKMIHGDTSPKPEPKVEETINIDIETEYEDMGQPLDRGDSEEY